MTPAEGLALKERLAKDVLQAWAQFGKLAYFGEPWPSGICETGQRVPTPAGERCELCGEPIEVGHQGTFMGRLDGGLGPVHRECNLRAVLGGIGHHEDHERWCTGEHDPDGGRSYRQSALEVWALVTERGIVA